jgi:Na+/H+-translocating membrane pyrophosphatase
MLTAIVRFVQLFSFPDPVNEVSARLVAGVVALLAVATIVFDLPWLTAVIAYGFVARVLTGPTLSPLGQIVTRVVTPRLPVAPRLVPGPPKRFAQGMGAVISLSAAVLALGLGLRGPAYVLLGALAIAATLESVFAFCLGCKIFALLMRVGLIPEDVCERCADIWSGSAATAR